MVKSLITGITGQDGSYLAELLLDKGNEVYGLHRRSSVDAYFGRIDHLKGKINLECGDLLDSCSLESVIKKIRPDEIYNLAAQSQVGISFSQPHLTTEINWLGVERLLDLVKNYTPEAKFYQASTSELFGEVLETPQSEKTPFNPVSPYAKSKLRAHEAVQRARDEDGIFACSGILFNHESPRRGLEFVTRKITDGIARIKLKLPQRETGEMHLDLGNLSAKRDWGYAKDYVNAMWLMFQQNIPDDFLIATGETHPVRKFVEVAANYTGIKINWEGEGLNEVGYNQEGEKIIGINKKYFRPIEVNQLVGDSSKARKIMKWKPTVKFDELVEMMVDADIKMLESKRN